VSTYVETAAQIAQEAGQIVQRIAAQRVGFELKGEHDLVTEADRASERKNVALTPALRAIAGMSIRWMAPPTSRIASLLTT